MTAVAAMFGDVARDGSLPVLDELSWNVDIASACHAARTLLDATPTLGAAVAAHVGAMPAATVSRLLAASAEKSTHYKWWLAGAPGSYQVWLHQYKEPAVFDMAGTYAASVHSHRYSFASRAVSGGYRVRYYRRRAGGPGLVVQRDEVMTAGASCVVLSADVHQIVEVLPGTCTVVVQGPIESGYSEVWRTVDGPPSRVPDLESLFHGLGARLLDLCGDPVPRPRSELGTGCDQGGRGPAFDCTAD